MFQRLEPLGREVDCYLEEIQMATEYGYADENWQKALSHWHSELAQQMNISREEFSARVALSKISSDGEVEKDGTYLVLWLDKDNSLFQVLCRSALAMVDIYFEENARTSSAASSFISKEPPWEFPIEVDFPAEKEIKWDGSFHQMFAHAVLKADIKFLPAFLDNLKLDGWK